MDGCVQSEINLYVSSVLNQPGPSTPLLLLPTPQYLQKRKIEGLQNLPSGIYLLPLSSPTKVIPEVNQESTGFYYKLSVHIHPPVAISFHNITYMYIYT